MGVVNASADSFSEERHASADFALARGLAHLDCGADLLDIGGESTRPGAAEVSGDLEKMRVIPVVKNLKKVHPEVILSVDTRHGDVARAALAAGVEIINDVSMLRHSPEIAELVARYDAGLILSHSRGVPADMAQYTDYSGAVAEVVAEELAAAKAEAVKAGVREENIMLDPGFGFAKTAEQCWELAETLEKVAPLSRMLVGVSRKSFLGALTGEADPLRRGGESLALELLLAARGVGMIRTHGVRELRNGLLVLRRMGGKMQ